VDYHRECEDRFNDIIDNDNWSDKKVFEQFDLVYKMAIINELRSMRDIFYSIKRKIERVL
jgi:hypothetical protein